MKQVNLEELEQELEKWRIECCLPCDVVVSMIEELRILRKYVKNEQRTNSSKKR